MTVNKKRKRLELLHKESQIQYENYVYKVFMAKRSFVETSLVKELQTKIFPNKSEVQIRNNLTYSPNNAQVDVYYTYNDSEHLIGSLKIGVTDKGGVDFFLEKKGNWKKTFLQARI